MTHLISLYFMSFNIFNLVESQPIQNQEAAAPIERSIISDGGIRPEDLDSLEEGFDNVFQARITNGIISSVLIAGLGAYGSVPALLGGPSSSIDQEVSNISLPLFLGFQSYFLGSAIASFITAGIYGTGNRYIDNARGENEKLNKRSLGKLYDTYNRHHKRVGILSFINGSLAAAWGGLSGTISFFYVFGNSNESEVAYFVAPLLVVGLGIWQIIYGSMLLWGDASASIEEMKKGKRLAWQPLISIDPYGSIIGGARFSF